MDRAQPIPRSSDRAVPGAPRGTDPRLNSAGGSLACLPASERVRLKPHPARARGARRPVSPTRAPAVWRRGEASASPAVAPRRGPRTTPAPGVDHVPRNASDVHCGRCSQGSSSGDRSVRSHGRTSAIRLRRSSPPACAHDPSARMTRQQSGLGRPVAQASSRTASSAGSWRWSPVAVRERMMSRIGETRMVRSGSSWSKSALRRSAA